MRLRFDFNKKGINMEKYLFIWLLLINVTAFAVFGIDKRRAIKGRFRVREATLFVLSLAGGALGALVAMYIFHHKTKKLYFRFGMPFILLAQVVLLLRLMKILPIC